MKKPSTLDKNLLKAAIKGDADAVDEYAQEGGDVETKDAMERTGLWHAAADGDTDMIMMLLKHGAEVNTADRDGILAIAIALEERHWEAAKLLAETADPRVTAGEKKLTALHSVFWMDLAEEKSDRVRFLMERWAKADIPDESGRTVVQHAQQLAAETPFAAQLLDIILEYKDGPVKRQEYLDKKRDDGIREAFSGTKRAIEVPERATFKPKVKAAQPGTP